MRATLDRPPLKWYEKSCFKGIIQDDEIPYDQEQDELIMSFEMQAKEESE